MKLTLLLAALLLTGCTITCVQPIPPLPQMTPHIAPEPSLLPTVTPDMRGTK